MTTAGECPIIVLAVLLSPLGNGVLGDLIFASSLSLGLSGFDFANNLDFELAGEDTAFY